MSSEYFTGRGIPHRNEAEGNKARDLSAGEKAMLARLAAKEDVPSATPRLNPDGTVVAHDVEALRRLREKTNGYVGGEESADFGDVVG